MFLNLPFSALLRWLRCAHDEWSKGNVETVVCLVPVRTDSSWFHTTLSTAADIYLLQGRVRFLNSSGKGQSTPFSLMIVGLRTTPEQRALCHTCAGVLDDTQRLGFARGTQRAMRPSVTSVIKTSFSGSRITPILLLWSWQTQEFSRSKKLANILGARLGAQMPKCREFSTDWDLLELTRVGTQ